MTEWINKLIGRQTNNQQITIKIKIWKINK